ncbi:MAG: hypothetical protein Q9172_006043 [Xanthocarpia lactea]
MSLFEAGDGVVSLLYACTTTNHRVPQGSDDLQLRRPKRPTFPSQQEDNDPTWAYIRINTGRNADGPWMPGIASLDSGTKEQWVSDTFLACVSDTDIEEVSLKEPDTYLTFSGTEFNATKGVVFSWHAIKTRITRRGTFRVVHNGPFDIIIGSDLLFSEGIYIFNEAALLFFHRKARQGEERRMQETLAMQDAEVRQYNVDQTAARATDRQRQRNNLEDGRSLQTSYTCRSGSVATTSNDNGWGTQYPSLPYSGTTPYSGHQSSNTPLCNSLVHHKPHLVQSPYTHSPTTNAPGPGFHSGPTTSPVGLQFDRSRHDGSSQQRDLSLSRKQRFHNEATGQQQGISFPQPSTNTETFNAPLIEQSSNEPEAVKTMRKLEPQTMDRSTNHSGV